jgi:lipase
MVLKTRSWGALGPDSVVCVHGLSQHGGVFERLGLALAGAGRGVVAVDLRGHGESGDEPPWDTQTQAQDLLRTLEHLGVDRPTLVGHSFGGRLAASVAARRGSSVQRLVLLEPALEINPERALRSAEIERLDWSFATADGAVNALLSSDSMVAPPRDVIAAFARADVRKGPDGRYRFRFCPSAAVVGWSESALPAPPVASIPTLLLHAEVSLADRVAREARYDEELGDLLTTVTVPNGHNVLWESPAETILAIEAFLDSGKGAVDR